MIRITGAREGNLKNLSLDIPKNKLVVFTGLSGSGKSTLLIDVLFTECQRLYLEAMGMQGIRKPEVERIDGASPAVLIPQSQNSYSANPRSTVGTVSDLYTDLRMLYEKLGVRDCPECGRAFSSADALEETKGSGDDFVVWQYCPHCGKKLDKLTRSHFSFNTAVGACPVCQGLGVRCDVRRQAAVDESLSLEEGAVRYWEKQYGDWQVSVLKKAKVPVVTTGAGNPSRFVKMWKEAGIVIIPVVASTALAKMVERAGVDAVIAEGGESGGHVGDLTTMALVPQVVDAVKLPVVAAGGIGDGRGMVAAFALGACGVQMGTRFLVADECTVSEEYKKKVLAAKDISTMVTGKRLGHPVRAIKNSYMNTYAKMEADSNIPDEQLEQFGVGSLRKAAKDGNADEGCFLAGQIAGMVNKRQSA